VNVACLRALGVEELGRTLTPASDVLGRAVGGAGAKLAAAAIAISAIGFLSQGMLTGPRVTFAMARDGLFFRGAAKVGVASRTPVMAIVLQAIWAAVLALSGSFEQILSYVTAMNFLFFGLTASSLFVIRRRETRAGKGSAEGFRTPLHPLTTGLFIVACVAIVGFSFWAQPRESLIGYGILLLGVPPYLFWRRASALAPAIP
jgi:APA family basic amino acid/polyamine antiporter